MSADEQKPEAQAPLEALASEQEVRALIEARMLPTDRDLSPGEITMVVADTRGYLDKRGYSVREAARRMGVSVRWLEAILGGGPASDEAARRLNGWIESDARAVAAQAKRDARRRYVQTNVARMFMRVVHLLAGMGRFGVVTGPGGIGKSFMAAFAASEVPGAVLLRVTQGTHTFVHFRAALARKVKVRAPTRLRGERWLAKNLDELVVEKLAGSHRLLIIDEAHRLDDACLDFLRDVSDLAGVSVLLVGTHDIVERMRADQVADLGQRSSRVAVAVNLADGYDPASGGEKLFTYEAIRQIFERERVRLVKEAICELSDQVNALGFGHLKRGESLVEHAVRLARSQAGLGADDEVTVTGAHVRAAEKLLVDRGLVVAVRREARPTVAAASA